MSFCLSGVAKDIIFVSTLTAAEQPSFESGYASSKLVGEKIVRKWIPEKNYKIVRLPFVSFDLNTGYLNSQDWLTLFARSCVLLKLFPLDFCVQLTTVPLNMLSWDCEFHPSAWSLDILFLQLSKRVQGSEMVPFKALLKEIIEKHAPAAAVSTLLVSMANSSRSMTQHPQLILSEDEVDKFLEALVK